MQQATLNDLSAFSAWFWNTAGHAKIFAFHGEMGAGKTTLITALCQYKGVQEVMGSPTFSIINQYVYEENGAEKMIYHIDLYRLKNMQEVINAGVEDCLYSGAICMVEWPEKAPELFDEANTIHVFIQPQTDTTRMVKMEKAAA